MRRARCSAKRKCSAISKQRRPHFARIRAGRIESRDTSSLHLDILRDAKRINSHIAAAAYPVLDRQGELLRSRLRGKAEEEDSASTLRSEG